MSYMKFWQCWVLGVSLLLSFVPVSGQLVRYMIILQTKNYLHQGGLCCTRKAQLWYLLWYTKTSLDCIFTQLLLLVLTWNLFCLDLALISGLKLDSASEPRLYEIFLLLLKICRYVKYPSLCPVLQWFKILDKTWDTVFQKSLNSGVKWWWRQFSIIISSTREDRTERAMNLDILASV